MQEPPQIRETGWGRFQRWLRGESETQLRLDQHMLDRLLPFHALVGPKGQILHAGPSLQKLWGANPTGERMDQSLLSIGSSGESEALPAAGDPSELEGRLLRLQLEAHPLLELSAQLLRLERHGQARWLLDLQPQLNEPDELASCGLTLQDLNLTHPLRTNMLDTLMARSLQSDLLEALQEQQRSELLE